MSVSVKFNPTTGQADLDKPVEGVYINALSIRESSSTSDGDTQTLLIKLQPLGEVEIQLDHSSGKYKLAARDCQVAVQEAPSGKAYQQLIEPGSGAKPS